MRTLRLASCVTDFSPYHSFYTVKCSAATSRLGPKLLCVHTPQPAGLDSSICFSPSSILGTSLNLRLSLKANLIFYPHLVLILHPHPSYHLAVVFGFASASIAIPH